MYLRGSSLDRRLYLIAFQIGCRLRIVMVSAETHSLGLLALMRDQWMFGSLLLRNLTGFQLLLVLILLLMMHLVLLHLWRNGIILVVVLIVLSLRLVRESIVNHFYVLLTITLVGSPAILLARRAMLLSTVALRPLILLLLLVENDHSAPITSLLGYRRLLGQVIVWDVFVLTIRCATIIDVMLLRSGQSHNIAIRILHVLQLASLPFRLALRFDEIRTVKEQIHGTIFVIVCVLGSETVWRSSWLVVIVHWLSVDYDAMVLLVEVVDHLEHLVWGLAIKHFLQHLPRAVSLLIVLVVVIVWRSVSISDHEAVCDIRIGQRVCPWAEKEFRRLVRRLLWVGSEWGSSDCAQLANICDMRMLLKVCSAHTGLVSITIEIIFSGSWDKLAFLCLVDAGSAHHIHLLIRAATCTWPWLREYQDLFIPFAVAIECGGLNHIARLRSCHWIMPFRFFLILSAVANCIAWFFLEHDGLLLIELRCNISKREQISPMACLQLTSIICLAILESSTATTMSSIILGWDLILVSCATLLNRLSFYLSIRSKWLCLITWFYWDMRSST